LMLLDSTRTVPIKMVYRSDHYGISKGVRACQALFISETAH
jgi:hypothetical protein